MPGRRSDRVEACSISHLRSILRCNIAIGAPRHDDLLRVGANSPRAASASEAKGKAQKKGPRGGPCGPSLGRKRPRRAVKPATSRQHHHPNLDVRRTICKEVFLHCRRPRMHSWAVKAHVGADALTPWAQRRGRSNAERPKSREETPKVGYDTSGIAGHAANFGIWACSCCGATVSMHKTRHLRTTVPTEQLVCVLPHQTYRNTHVWQLGRLSWDELRREASEDAGLMP